MAQLVPMQGRAYWWAGRVHRLCSMVFLWFVSAPWWVRLVWGLQKAPWRVGLWPRELWGWPPPPTVGKTGSWVLWWVGPCPEWAAGSAGLKAACVLIVRLCPHPVRYLASGISVLVLTGLLAGAGLGPGPNQVEGRFHDGACQSQCPHGRMNSPEWMPPVSVSSG